jgi:hypothetical protein
MNIGFLLYQAERTPDRAEQRAVDAQRGELARALSGLLHPRRRIDHRPQAECTGITVPDYLPTDWVSTPR